VTNSLAPCVLVRVSGVFPSVFLCAGVFGFYSIRFVAKVLLKEQIKVALDWNEKNMLCFCS